MASCRSLFIILALIFPAIASAKDFVVGDKTGWTINFDYQAWATGKDFQVGDRLVFKYPVGLHTVLKVNGTGFQNCIKPPPTEALTSGNDIIVLATPGVNGTFVVSASTALPVAKSCSLTSTPSGWLQVLLLHNIKLCLIYTNSGNGFAINIFYTVMVMTVAVSAIFGF